uniref:Uncharacterized protein n=1 Tax=Ditylenchus dipsaci TaxID=166011 RepID=A0A915E1L1_9BILA
MGFEVEIYDEQNVDFLYHDQAPKKIVSFVKDLRQDNMKFINCTLSEHADKTRVPANSNWLLAFIEKYKQRCEEIPLVKKQFENLQNGSQRAIALMIQELHDKNDELMDEVRNRAAEAKHASEEAETLEADLRVFVSASYKSQLAELQEITDDNQKFVEDLEQCESECAALQEQLKESINQQNEFRRLYKAADAQLKSCKGSSDHYKKVSEPRVERSERENDVLKAEKSQLSIEMEATAGVMSATVRHSSLGVPGSKRGAATVYDEKVNWRNPHTRDLSANKTEEYQCRYARMKNYRCSIKLRVLYPQDNFKFDDAAKNVWMLIKRAMCYAHSEEELGLMYNELQNNSFVDWKRYELIRHSIRIVRPSTIWLGYWSCAQRKTVLSPEQRESASEKRKWAVKISIQSLSFS